MPFSKENRSNTFNGILFVALFALSSLYLAEQPWMAKTGISALVIAIVLGIIYSNTLHHRMPQQWAPGIQFAAKRLLRLAIILYGFRVSFQQIISIGPQGILIDAIVVISTLIFGAWIGIKIFKLDRHLAILISIGAAICGAAAVLAAEDVLKSEPYKTAVAIGTVVLFGTIAMLLYPFLQHLGIFGLDESQYGVYVGASVHEVAQALVAGSSISLEAGNTAVIVKMTRVLMLVPMLFCLAIYETRFASKNAKDKSVQKKNALNIPWFAVAFVAVIGFNSLDLLPTVLVNAINQFDIFLLTMAMAAIGIETNINKIKHVGMKPLYLATVLFFWLMIGVCLLI